MNRCGAFETQTGRQCVLESDHGGAHVMQSPLGRMRFDDMTEAAFESILEARRGQSLFERLRRENDRLREAIKTAPHAMGCHSIQAEFLHTEEWATLEYCDCWKRATLSKGE